MPIDLNNENVVLVDGSEVPLAVASGAAIPAGTKALLAAGSDGTNARAFLVDTSARQVVAGAGTAGAGAGGVMTVQGAAGGTALPISGTVTATNPSVGTNASAAPTSSTQIGGSDGTNLQAVRMKAAATAAVSADPALVVAVSPNNSVAITAASLPLPTGAATQTTLASIDTKTLPAGQALMAASSPVVIASNQSAVPISAASLPLPTGAATAALQTQPGVDIGDVTVNNAGGAAAVNIQDGGNSITVDGTVSVAGTVPISAVSLPLPTGAATEATLATRLADATFTARVNTLGQKTMANSTPIVIASDQSAIPITGSITATNPSVGTNAAAAPTSSTQIGATDGTNLIAARMKGPSTAAVAADPALVVAISPNNPITVSNPSVGTNGAAAPTSSTQAGGSDGTNLRPVLVDTSGRQIVVGAAADGAAATGNPVLVGGSDGTNVRAIETDTTGRPIVVGASSAAGTYTGGILSAQQVEEETFTVLAPSVAIGLNKSMISIVNATASTKTLRIHEIKIVNVQTTAVTGVVAQFELHRLTAATVSHTGGTVLTPDAMDTNDTLNANITVRTGATLTTLAAAVLNRWFWSSDEWGTGTLDEEGLEHTMQNVLNAYIVGPKKKPFTLRPNQGMSIQQITNSTAGTFDLLITMSQVN